jgi:predicted DNA binding protein
MDVTGAKEWTDDARITENVNVRIVSCKPNGKSGMLHYAEISRKGDIDEVISHIKANPNVKDSEFTRTDESRATVLVVTNNSPVCRSIWKRDGFCTNCLLSGDRKRSSWRIALSGKDSFNELLSDLDENGLTVTIRDSKMLQNGTLTFDQSKIIRIAEEQGYFEFPRRVSLTELAQRLHMSKSNLEEILRRAEHKIVGNYVKRTNENLVTTVK